MSITKFLHLRAKAPSSVDNYSTTLNPRAAVTPPAITPEYRRLICGLGYASGDEVAANQGLLSAESLRQSPGFAATGTQLDKHFRYAAVLPESKLGVSHLFEIDGAPCLYFKSLAAEPTLEQIRKWHHAAWNHGLGRMLWIVTPQLVRVLNAFEPPVAESESISATHPAEILRAATHDLEKLRRFELDRISMESGKFWSTSAGRKIQKSTRIDEELAGDLQQAAEQLQLLGCSSLKSHRLMLRTLFTAYLEARGILPASLFGGLAGRSFSEVLADTDESAIFFERMRQTFNGDLFPPPPQTGTDDDSFHYTLQQLRIARAIVTRTDLTSGQMTLEFARYDFQVIPIELISSIYERFIYAGNPGLAKSRRTHYTPVNLVDLTLTHVFDDELFKTPLDVKPKVLDLACGSAVFLVEAFRRLLGRRIVQGEKWTRGLVRDVLFEQLYGVDLESTAIEIAAFSLCLTAFELDPSPDSAIQLKFPQSLKGRNLFVADAFCDKELSAYPVLCESQFSIVIGNPPWSKTSGSKGSEEKSEQSHIQFCAEHSPPISLGFRSPIDQAFIWRGKHFARQGGRLGMIVDAKNFFSQVEESIEARQQLYNALPPRLLMNLSLLHNKKLFPSAEQPTMIFIAENLKPGARDQVVFASAERNDSFRGHGIVELFIERVNRLPLQKLISNRYLLKTASFGTARDHAIVSGVLERYRPLKEVVHSWGAAFITGYKGRDGERPIPERMQEMPKLERANLTRGRFSVTGLPPFDYGSLDAPRNPQIYEPPLCVTQQQLRDNRLVAASFSESVAYARSYFGASCQQAWQANVLASYLNSSVAAYCFLLTATRFGVDRQIAELTDIEKLPLPQVEPSSEIVKRLSKFGCMTEGQLKVDGFAELDAAIFDLFEMEQWERDYVTDTVNFEIDFLRQGNRSMAVDIPEVDALKSYARILVSAIRASLSATAIKVNADVIACMSELQAVALSFDEELNRDVGIIEDGDYSFSGRLSELLSAPLTSSFQLRRSMITNAGKHCVIVKHAQRRFWSRARAYDDADAILVELLKR